MPILNSPAVFNVLAFLVALAGFLRSISRKGQEVADTIMQGGNPDYPKGSPHTRSKLDLIERTRRAIETITPWLFGFMVGVAVRIVAFAVWPNPQAQSDISGILRAADILICVALLALVCALWVMHWRAKTAEGLISGQLAQWRAPAVVDRVLPS